MVEKSNTAKKLQSPKERGILASFFLSLGETLLRFVIAFAVGTGAGALVCWYYGFPLVFSLVGGILVLGIALALTSDSIFS